MKKESLLLIITIILISTFILGCGSSDDSFDSENIEDNRNNSLEVVSSDNGSLKETYTKSGMSVKGESGTFPPGLIITLTEEDFKEQPYKFFKNGDKIYTINGKLIRDSLIGNISLINTLEKSYLIKVPNSLQIDVDEYYIGTRDDALDNWHFCRINETTNSNSEPQNIFNVRASSSKPYFYLKTSKLGFQFALFGLGKSKETEAIAIVKTVVPSVLPADRDISDGEGTKINTSNGKYDENIKVRLELNGQNISQILPEDYLVEIEYVSTDYNINKQIFGQNAKYESPIQNESSKGTYIHKVTTNNFIINKNGNIELGLNTKDIELSDFPLDFSISLKNARDVNNCVPFKYSESIHIENSQTIPPMTPINVKTLSSRIKLGDDFTIKWDSPDEDKSINKIYDIYIVKDNNEEIIAANIASTSYIFSNSVKSLTKGKYEFYIIAKNTAGQSKPSERVKIEIIESELSIPTFVVLPEELYIGIATTISWNKVSDPEGKEIIYNLWLCKDEISSEPTFSNISSTSILLNTANLLPGTYFIKLEASNKEISTESDIFQILVKEQSLDKPIINLERNRFNISEEINITWSEIKDLADGDIYYNIYIATEPSAIQQPCAKTSESQYTFKPNSKGLYYLIVEVSNGFASSKSDPTTFEVIDSKLEIPVIAKINTVYQASGSLEINWNAVSSENAKEVKYDLWFCKDILTASPTFSLSSNSKIINLTDYASGSYTIKVCASDGFSKSESETCKIEIVPVLSAKIYDKDSRILNNFYKSSPTFYVNIEAGNKFEHQALLNAIKINGGNNVKPELQWLNDNELSITFKEPLQVNTEYSVKMTEITDNFGFTIESFQPLSFKVLSFSGSGTSEAPFIADFLTTNIQNIPDSDEVSLIATPTTYIEAFKDIFGDCIFSPTARIICESASSISFTCPAIISNNEINLNLEENLWPANQSITAKIIFSINEKEKDIFFETQPISFRTETGNTITLGNGTKESPYLVYTPAQLDNVREHLLDIEAWMNDIIVRYPEEVPLNILSEFKDKKAFFMQMRNIDLKDYISNHYSLEGWKPIGDQIVSLDSEEDYANKKVFFGGYYGNNKSIENLYINIGPSSELEYCGLFGCVMGSITDLTLNNSKIICDSNEYLQFCSALVGITTQFDSIFTSLPEEFTRDFENEYKIKNCKVLNTSIEATNCDYLFTVAMLAGGNVGNDISDIDLSGSINVSNSCCESIGPLCAYQLISNVQNVTSNCNISIQHSDVSCVSGLAGMLLYGPDEKSYIIDNCIANGKISGFSLNTCYTIGGIIGSIQSDSPAEYIKNTEVKNCVSNVEFELTDIYSSEVTIGGIIGITYIMSDDIYDEIKVKLSNCSFNGKMSLKEFVRVNLCAGGIAGIANFTDISDSNVKGEINCSNSIAFSMVIGGITGILGIDSEYSYSTINNSSTYNTAKIIIDGVSEPNNNFGNERTYLISVGKLVGIDASSINMGNESMQNCTSENSISLTNHSPSSNIHIGGDVGFKYD